MLSEVREDKQPWKDSAKEIRVVETSAIHRSWEHVQMGVKPAPIGVGWEKGKEGGGSTAKGGEAREGRKNVPEVESALLFVVCGGVWDDRSWAIAIYSE